MMRWFSYRTTVVRVENLQQTVLQQNSMTQRAPACRSISAVGTCAIPVTASDGHALWQAIVDDLQDTMTRENAEAWLTPARVLAYDGQTMRVAAPTLTHQHWLDRRLRRKIDAALRRQGLEDLCVVFEVTP